MIYWAGLVGGLVTFSAGVVQKMLEYSVGQVEVSRCFFALYVPGL